MGAGVIIVPPTDRLLNGVPPAMAGVASGAFNASRQVGAAIGVALFGAILSQGRAFIDRAHLTFVFAAAAALLAVPLTRALRAHHGPELPATSGEGALVSVEAQDQGLPWRDERSGTRSCCTAPTKGG
jgi:hypothetical protein